MYPYATVDEALTDVLRRVKRMTYKNAIAGLPLAAANASSSPTLQGPISPICYAPSPACAGPGAGDIGRRSM